MGSRMNRGRLSRGMLPLLGLQVLSEYSRLDRKPPVTTALLLANTLIYLRPGFLHKILPSVREVCLNAHLIFENKDVKRFFLSAFYHMGDSHLVYNMLSLLWKGIKLEIAMGSVKFAAMVAQLLAMSHGIAILLAKALLLFDYDRPYYYECTVGFSGVLFAMKVVLNSQSSDYTYIYGILVPARFAAWAELILIQLFVPGVSFMGHLGGVLAGLLYLHLWRSHHGPGPLARLLKHIVGTLSWPLRFLCDVLGFQRRQISSRGTVGRDSPYTRDVSGAWRCPACTFDNAEQLNVCEMCGRGRGSERL